jgi:hypothetical protein
MANKTLVLTASALSNFGIRARHNVSVVLLALSCRTGRGSGGTTQALGHILVNMNSSISKYVFLLHIGAIWNVMFGSLGCFNLKLSNSLFLKNFTPMTQLIANRTWWCLVLLAGVGYGIVGCIPHKFRFFVTFGVLGKIMLFLFATYLWLNSSATGFAMIVATGDLLWALYFIYFLYQTKEYGFL